MTQEMKDAGPDRPEFDMAGDALAAVLFNGEPGTHAIVGPDAAVGSDAIVETDATDEIVGTDAIVIDLRTGEPIVDARPFTPIVGGLLEASAWERAAKRSLDIVGACFAVLLLLPVIVIATGAVAFTSRGPVLFAQERVGLRGRPFRMLKFRSMYRDAEARRDALQSLNHHRTGPIFKIPNDPRITPVGRAIRRLSIDELPQLLNILRGSMSLVGPRPPLPTEVKTYNAWEAQRLLIKPGITCIWQVSGRSELDFETWVTLDLEYIESWSLWLDLKLLARTIPAVLSTRGAY